MFVITYITQDPQTNSVSYHTYEHPSNIPNILEDDYKTIKEKISHNSHIVNVLYVSDKKEHDLILTKDNWDDVEWHNWY
jgi:hypothetical protein